MFVRAFVLTWLAYFGLYLCRKNFSVVMPFLKQELGFSSEQLGNVLFFYGLAYAIGQVVMGAFSDRWGARLVVSIGTWVSSVCSVLTSFGTALPVVQGANGMAQAAGWPGVLKMARDWFPESNRGVILAWWGTHMVLGGLAGSAFAAYCSRFGWRWAAIAPAIILTGIGLAFFLFSRDKQRSATWKFTWPWADRDLLANRRLRSIVMMYFFVKMLRYAFIFWLPLYMTEELRYTPENAGYASAIFEFVGFGGVLLAGYWSENGNPGKRFSVSATMMFLLAGLCILYPHVSPVAPWVNILMIGLIGAFTFGPDTLMAGAGVQEAVRPDKTASAGGLVNGLGSTGQILSPLIVAALSAKFGWPVLFAFLGCGAALGGVVLAIEMGKKWEVAAEEA
ncbi:MAG: MFS transporter [Bryobacter sp.]